MKPNPHGRKWALGMILTGLRHLRRIDAGLPVRVLRILLRHYEGR